MKTICTDAPGDQRVGGDTMFVASQTGQPTPELGEETTGTLRLYEDVGESALTTSVRDDDISPDDAPEVMSEGDGEVRDFISIGAMKHGY
jgi:hypothetical protein